MRYLSCLSRPNRCLSITIKHTNMENTFTKTIGTFIFCFIYLASGMAQEQKPNILWIITDDQRADALECYNLATTGKKESPLGYVQSPNIDRLADEGTLFVNAYNNSPMCAISRASMHMGRYPFRSGHYKFFSHQEADVSKPLYPKY